MFQRIVKTIYSRQRNQLATTLEAVENEISMQLDPQNQVKLKRRREDILLQLERLENQEQKILRYRHYLWVVVPIIIGMLVFFLPGICICFFPPQVTVAKSATSVVATYISGDESAPQIANLIDEIGQDLTVTNQADDSQSANIMHVEILEGDSDEVVDLHIVLPIEPAYRLDFWDEFRAFESLGISIQEAAVIIEAAEKYSRGDYTGVSQLLANRTVSNDIAIMRAQANLFTGRYAESRNDYTFVLELLLQDKAAQDHNITKINNLRLGLALAYWRDGFLQKTDRIQHQTERCPAALSLYDEILAADPTNGDVMVIKEVAKLYCNEFDERAEWIDTQNQIRELGPTNTDMVNFWDGLANARWHAPDSSDIPNRFGPASETVVIAHRELAQWHIDQMGRSLDGCQQAAAVTQRYLDQIVTEKDQELGQELIDQIYKHPLADFCF